MSRNADRKRRRREHRARKNPELNKAQAMIDEPQADNESAAPEPQKRNDSFVAAALNLPPAGTRQAKKQNAPNNAKYPQNIVWPFVAIWRGIVILARGRWIIAAFRLFDLHSGRSNNRK